MGPGRVLCILASIRRLSRRDRILFSTLLSTKAALLCSQVKWRSRALLPISKAFLMAPFKACSHELHNEVAFEAPLSLAVRWFQGEDFAPLQAFEEPARKSCCVG